MGTRIALLFFCSVTAFAQSNTPDTKSSFEGSVVDAVTGEPLRKAFLLLSADAYNHSAVSGLDGHFVASGLDAGDYKIHVERQGYLDCDCLSGVKISTGQKITGVQIKLTQYGAISGRVVDADGDVWPRGSVAIYRMAWKQGKRKLDDQDQSDVDDRGVFRIGKLPPGRYFLAAQPGGRLIGAPALYQTTFYPGALEPSAAVPISLGSGQEISGIEIKLTSASTYNIRGRINGGEPLESTSQQLAMGISRQSGLLDDRPEAALDRKPDGAFEFRGVPSGSYTIKVEAMSGMRGFVDSAAVGEAAVQVNGHDVNDVVIDLVPPKPLKVSVEVEGVNHPDLSSVSLQLHADSGGFAVTSANNDFTFSRVSLAAYQLHVQSSTSHKYFVKAIRVGSVESPGPMLDLRRAGDEPVTVILSDKGAEIKAVIKADSPVPAHTTVILIPDIPDPDLRERLSREVTPDQNGVYSIAKIPPGDYKLFAWQDLPEDAWQDADFWSAMKDRGASVKLAESEKKSIELPLIPAPETTALLARLGIQ